MKLYVIRHGEAIDRSAAVREEDRWLTPAGRYEFRANARRLAKKGIVPDCIVTSPLVRAVQTADILADVLGFGGEIRVSRELAPGFGVEGLFRLVDANGTPRSLAVVGHEPDLGEVVARLLGIEGALLLKKGVIMALELEPSLSAEPARFRWLIHQGEKISELPGHGKAR